MAFSLFFAAVIVVGEVEGVPDNKQDQGEDRVACIVQTGEIEEAVFGRIAGMIIYRNGFTLFHFVIYGSQSNIEGITRQEMHLTGTG